MKCATPTVALVALTVTGCTTSGPPRTGHETVPELPTTTATATAEVSVEPSATMAASATPETAFGEAETCENGELGYAVSYPAEWWVNESIEPDDPNLSPIPACQYFAPEEVDLRPNAGLPGGLAIWFEMREEDLQPADDVLSEETVMVAGQEAQRLEFAPVSQAGFIPEGSHVYVYVLEHGGGQLVAQTDDIHQDGAAYERSREILDSMMETLKLQEAQPTMSRPLQPSTVTRPTMP